MVQPGIYAIGQHTGSILRRSDLERRRSSQEPDYLMKQSHSSGDILRTWVAYTLAMEIQTSSSLRWMDHAPLYMDMLYRCWHDANVATRPEVCTIAQADVLRRSSELQEQLCTFANEELACAEDIFECAKQRCNADLFSTRLMMLFEKQ